MTANQGKPDPTELIRKFFEKRYPADIEQRFHLWLLGEYKKEEKEIALEDMWEAVPYGNISDARSSLQQVKRKLGMAGATVRPLRSSIAFKVAAVVVPLLILAGVFVIREGIPFDRAGRVAYLEAYAGTTVSLPDNSVVDVKEGVLVYPSQFKGGERRVKLDGSGYFTVEADPSNPFIVDGTALSVRVTGTQFLFETAGENTKSRVTLVEGTVDVLIEGTEPVKLSEGRELTYEPVSGNFEIADLPAALTDKEALTNRKLVFSNAPLDEILRTVARSRGLGIEIEPGFSGNKKYTVKFTGGETLEEIFEVLKLLAKDFNYRLSDGAIYIE